MKLYKIKKAQRFGADAYFNHLGIWFPIFSTLEYRIASMTTSDKKFDLAINTSVKRMRGNK